MKVLTFFLFTIFSTVSFSGTNAYSTIPNDLEAKIRDAIYENKLNPILYFSTNNIEIQLKNDNYQYSMINKNGYYEYEIDVQQTQNKYTKLHRLYNQRAFLYEKFEKCEITKSDNEEADRLINIPTVSYLFSTIDDQSLNNAELRLNKYCNKKFDKNLKFYMEVFLSHRVTQFL